jgi:hypothetical protein
MRHVKKDTKEGEARTQNEIDGRTFRRPAAQDKQAVVNCLSRG